MDLEDYIEGIEPMLSMNEGRVVIRCVCEIAKLLRDVMPESGNSGIKVVESFLSRNATTEDLVTARVAIWEDHDQNFKGTPQGEALRAVICALFFPIENDEYFDTLSYAIDFSRNAKPGLNDGMLRAIIENEFKT